MDLFDYMREKDMEKESPLASRLRPRTLDEVVGQQHIVGKDKLLYRAIQADKLGSIIFYGPPGTGKTTLAKVIANTTSADFRQINATVGIYDADIDEDAADFLADTANGDARAALNAVELGVLTTAKGADGRIHIDMAVAQECIQKRAVRYDKNGDNHYDTISAFIKSMRGSDPDAAVYYLARMLYAGEDIKFIARRIMICAAEDVGNADPQALVVAVNAAQAAERIGIPEANIILSQAVTYVATAPKSNAACMAVQKAMEAVRNERTMPVPVHLQDKHYKGAEKLGHGAGYLYAHDYPKHYVQQQYLPEGMEGTVFYEPSDNGYEKQINAHMKWLKS